jgi:hypothetical protein
MVEIGRAGMAEGNLVAGDPANFTQAISSCDHICVMRKLRSPARSAESCSCDACVASFLDR